MVTAVEKAVVSWRTMVHISKKYPVKRPDRIQSRRLSSSAPYLSSVWHIPSPRPPSQSPLPSDQAPVASVADGSRDPGSALFVFEEPEPSALGTFHSATEVLRESVLLARKEHSCVLIFICIAAIRGHKIRPWERQQHTAYKGRDGLKERDERVGGVQ